MSQIIEDIERLKEIKDGILELVDEARTILSPYGIIYQRAVSYWIAHTEIAISNNHGYLGGSMCSLDDSISELEELGKTECEEGGEEGGEGGDSEEDEYSDKDGEYNSEDEQSLYSDIP